MSKSNALAVITVFTFLCGLGAGLIISDISSSTNRGSSGLSAKITLVDTLANGRTEPTGFSMNLNDLSYDRRANVTLVPSPDKTHVLLLKRGPDTDIMSVHSLDGLMSRSIAEDAPSPDGWLEMDGAVWALDSQSITYSQVTFEASSHVHSTYSVNVMTGERTLVEQQKTLLPESN